PGSRLASMVVAVQELVAHGLTRLICFSPPQAEDAFWPRHQPFIGSVLYATDDAARPVPFAVEARTRVLTLQTARPDARADHLIRALRGGFRWRPGQACSERDLIAVGRALLHRHVAVVLGGGGAHGFAHVALLEQLEAAGIDVDLIVAGGLGAL